MIKKDIHLEIFKVTVKKLRGLHQDLVFIGGATISLFITEPAAVRIRETYDVDCVVEVSSRTEYEKIAVKLRKIGFHEDSDSRVICRFKNDDLTLDVMPTDSEILGFSNKWYKKGIAQAQKIKIAGEEIQVFTIPYLIATKIEAFKGRGKGDFLVSHDIEDIEDIVTLIDGRKEITSDLLNAPLGVLKELKNEFTSFMNNNFFLDSLDGHISDRANITGRKQIILDRIKKFID
jgi:hypothetical protein